MKRLLIDWNVSPPRHICDFQRNYIMTIIPDGRRLVNLKREYALIRSTPPKFRSIRAEVAIRSAIFKGKMAVFRLFPNFTEIVSHYFTITYNFTKLAFKSTPGWRYNGIRIRTKRQKYRPPTSAYHVIWQERNAYPNAIRLKIMSWF